MGGAQFSLPRSYENTHAPLTAPLAPISNPASDGPEPAGEGLVVGAVLINGAPEIDPAAFMPVITPFIGHQLHRQDLQDLLAVISGVARGKGYDLAHSTIAPQTFRAGVLKVSLDLGRIDRIDILGENSPAVRAILSRLLGKPALQAQLERQLMLAADLPGIVIGHASYIRDGNQGVLQVEVHHKAVSLHANLDNRGNSTLGPVRMALAYDLNGILGEERLSASGQFQTTPAHPNELVSTAARIAYVFDDKGTQLALSGAVSHTQPGGRLAALNSIGSVRDVELALDHPLLRGRTTSLWLSASIAYQALDQWQGPVILWHDRASLVGLSVNGFTPLAQGRLRGGLTGQWMLAWPGMTTSTNPLASRPGAGAGARILNGWASWEGKLAGPFSAKIALSGQLADAPLPIAQQLGLGGPDFGRAYDYGERTGDEGALGSLEIQYNIPTQVAGGLAPAIIYGFVDGGYVANLDNALGTGSLMSAGFGSRLVFMQKVNLGLEMAFPITQPRYDTGNRAPRVSFNMGANF